MRGCPVCGIVGAHDALRHRGYVQRLEHECEVAGHEAGCDYCEGRAVTGYRVPFTIDPTLALTR